jgi:hypothetical protein
MMFDMPDDRSVKFYKFTAGCGLFVVVAATVALSVFDRQDSAWHLPVRQNLKSGEADADGKALEDVFADTSNAEVSEFFEKGNELAAQRSRRSHALSKVRSGRIALMLISLVLWRGGWFPRPLTESRN